MCAFARRVVTGCLTAPSDLRRTIVVFFYGLPKVDDNGDYVNVVFKHGGFEVDSVELNKITNAAPPIMANNTTCSVEFGASGPVTLFNGTGMYAGISGNLQITQRFAAVGSRYTSGPKKGQCNMSNNSQPIAFWGSITGAGKVSFT